MAAYIMSTNEQTNSDFNETSNKDIVELPKILYKYRFWNSDPNNSFHKHLLTKNEMYFSKPSAFNDPFDCQIALRLDLGNDKEKRRFLVKKHKKEWPDVSPKKRAALVNERIRSFSDPIKMKEESRRLIDDGWGVESFSANPRDLLMWAHYADSHRGICIGLSYEVLKEFSDNLFVQKGIYSDIFKVDYVEEYPIYAPFVDKNYKMGNWQRMAIKTKSSHWKHEEEYRLILGTDSNTERRYILPDEAIKIVIIGYSMPVELQEEIQNVIQSKNTHIHLVQAKLSEYHFSLDIDLPAIDDVD